MQLYIGIGVIVVGVLAAVLGFSNVVPNIGGAGVALVLLGGLIIGLSFVPEPDKEGVEEMPLWSRLINIFVSPGEVFKNIRYHPTWLGVVLVTSLLSGAYFYLFVDRITPERITNYSVEKIAESGFVQEDQIETVRAQTLETNSDTFARIASGVSGFVGQAFLVAFFGVLFFLTVLAFGGKINYLQAISVAAFSLFPIIAIQKLLSLVILFLKDPLEIHPMIGQGSLLPDNLGILVSPGDSPVLYTVLTYLGLLGIYWLWLNATGLKAAGRRVPASAAWTASLILWLLGLAVSVVFAFLFGNFLS